MAMSQERPSEEQIENRSEGIQQIVSVLDDMLLQVAKSELSLNSFYITTHHHRVSVFMLPVAHTLCMPGMFARFIKLYEVILFCNVRFSKHEISFGSQVFNLKLKHFKAPHIYPLNIEL